MKVAHTCRVGLMVALSVLTAGIVWSQNLPDVPRTPFWVTDGVVGAIVQHDNIVYIAGDFDNVGMNTGALAPLEAATGQAAIFPRVNDSVRACIQDGNGGWFIGGDFTEVGGLPRNHLAHINADGTVSDWNPNANHRVRALALSLNGSVLYVGGDFTSIGGELRNCIAAVSAANGALTAWNPNANDSVYAFKLASAGPNEIIYVGGAFTQIGGENRARLAMFIAGELDAWNPNANGTVRTLALSGDGENLGVGGDFTSIGALARNRIGVVSTDDGAVRDWNPNANGPVFAILPTADDAIVYVAGEFSNIGGQDRTAVAAIRADNGLATDWNPNVWGNLNDRINAVALSSDEETLYVAGDISVVGGVMNQRYNVAAINTDTAEPRDWIPKLNAEVFALCLVADESVVMAGGQFSSAGLTPRSRLAAFDVTAGTLKAWNPGANDEVFALAISPDGSLVYAGGRFTQIGGEAVQNLAAIESDTGELADWEPDPNLPVNALALSGDGSLLYAGGRFAAIGGAARDYIAAVRTDNAQATGWNPGAGGDVHALALSPDESIVYAGGTFLAAGGQPRSRIAALNTGSSTATDWNPSANSEVVALALSPDGSIVYAGGDFTRMNIVAEDRRHIAAINAATGIPTDWNPHANASVNALAVSLDGSQVYAGGSFATIGGLSRNCIVAIDAASGGATDWNPRADSHLYSLAFSGDGKILYAGGEFSRMGNVMYGFAIFSPQHTLTYTAGANGAISGMATQIVYHRCDGAEVTAVPDTGYHFTQWSDSSTANPRRDLNVTDDITVAASFALTLTAPDTPSGVSASAGDHIGEVRLAWTAAARAVGYEIWRALSAAGAEMTLQGVSVGTAFTDTDVGPNVNYYYWIRATNAAGDSALSSVAHGFPGVRGPMIMANGQVGNVRVGPSTALSLTARLHKGDLPAVMVDWWVAAYLQNSGEWYYMTLDRTWHPFDVNLRNCLPVAIGPLADLPETVVAEFGGLPPGSYHIWFVVDYPGDGILHLTPGYHLTANVNIIVE